MLNLEILRATLDAQVAAYMGSKPEYDPELESDCRFLLGVDPTRTPDQVMQAASRVTEKFVHRECQKIEGDLHERIAELEGLLRISMPKISGVAEPVRISWRKNVEVAPYKHEHAEVTVELNGATFEEGVQRAKDLVDQALGVDVDEDDVEYAKEILRKAARATSKTRSRNAVAPGRYSDAQLVDPYRKEGY